jgi:hypothetical protein
MVIAVSGSAVIGIENYSIKTTGQSSGFALFFI